MVPWYVAKYSILFTYTICVIGDAIAPDSITAAFPAPVCNCQVFLSFFGFAPLDC